MQETAVEWLIEKLPTINKYDPYYEEIIQQAKAMEKNQIMNSWALGVTSDGNMTSEQYYNEQYVSKESDNHIGDANEMVEISDEEIIKLANEHILYNDSKRQWVIEGMKLYREQLKKK